MLRKTPKFEAPTLDTLRRQNPELYAEFMSTLRDARRMSDMAAQRQGLSSAQQASLQDTTSQINQQLANRGLVGSSAGTQLSADARSRAMGNLLQQALQERMGLMQGAQQARGNAASLFQQGTAPAAQAGQMNVQAQMANDAAMNQFFSGLLGAGANMYATNQLFPVSSPTGGVMANPVNQSVMQPWNGGVQYGQSYQPFRPQFNLGR
jgi:uncharacterized membrane protein